MRILRFIALLGIIGACAGLLSAQAVDLSVFDTSDSFYQVSETHTGKVLTAGEAGADRAGWREQTDEVRFGAFGFRVVQRINPATQMPDQVASRWGDNFLGITHSKKPADYMASNWSPWSFLSASIRFTGETKDIPQPTQRGRLVYLTLREVTRKRAVAEALWKDPVGGYLRARFIGLHGADRFTLAVRYFPPPGKEIESASYTLSCGPYDLNDRGYWERVRWMQTPVRNAALSDARLSLDPSKEWQVALYNRYAQNDAGTLLAVHPHTVKALALAGTWSVQATLTPAAPDGEVVAACSDWCAEVYATAATRFFGLLQPVADELNNAMTLALPLPPQPDAADAAETEALLQACPALRDRFGAEIQTARATLQASWDALQKDANNPSLFAAWMAAHQHYRTLDQDARTLWVKERLWDQ